MNWNSNTRAIALLTIYFHCIYMKDIQHDQFLSLFIFYGFLSFCVCLSFSTFIVLIQFNCCQLNKLTNSSVIDTVYTVNSVLCTYTLIIAPYQLGTKWIDNRDKGFQIWNQSSKVSIQKKMKEMRTTASKQTTTRNYKNILTWRLILFDECENVFH